MLKTFFLFIIYLVYIKFYKQSLLNDFSQKILKKAVFNTVNNYLESYPCLLANLLMICCVIFIIDEFR